MTSNWFERVVLKNVVPLNKDLGRGSYGKVFTVKYCGLICAAKEIHSVLLEVQDDVRESVIRGFLWECCRYSELRHPNIVQFMGVYYGSNGDESNLPIMVMELMDQSLTSLVKKQKHIEMKVKMSILHDVSLGLSYLHSQDEPIVHCNLSPNNVLLTAHMVAKISDLGIARVLKLHTDTTRARSIFTQVPGTLDFMAPETFYDNPTYNTSIDVFSFAGIALHLICEEWPSPTHPTQIDTKTGKLVAFTEVERRRKYLDKMNSKISTVLKPLLENCLDNDPSLRPAITAVSENIELVKNYPQDMVDESKFGDPSNTGKVKPPIQRRTVYHSNPAPTELDHNHLISLSTNYNGHHCTESLPRSKSSSSLYPDLTASLPENFDPKSDQVFYSESPNVNVGDSSTCLPGNDAKRCIETDSSCSSSDLDTSSTLPPSNVNSRQLKYRPVPKPRAFSCIDIPDIKTSNDDSSPPKITNPNIEQLVKQYKAATVEFTKESKPNKVSLLPALQSGKYSIKWRRCANLMCPMYAASIATDKEYVYVMGDCAEKQALNVVFAYTIATDLWTKLPPSDHCWGVLQMVGDKLAIFGGIDDYTKKRTNRVSTFDKSTKSWRHFYPDMIDVRFRPGVATHLDYVIVAGGNKDPINIHKDIEVLNWHLCNQLQWVKSSVSLPVPMWAFSPIVSDDELYIVGYSGEGNKTHKEAYKIAVVLITSTMGQGRNEWLNITPSSYYYNTLIPNSSPPVYVGGEDKQGVQSSNVSMYDSFSNSWRYVDSLSSPRSSVAVATIDDYSIIVIGGYTKGHSTTAAKLSSLPIVEIGQAELA